MVVLTGMRRTGKTTLLKMVFDTIESNNKVFIDLDNILDQKIFEENDFNAIWSNLRSFGVNKDEKAYIFIDEIQSKPDIVKALKYLYDHYKVKFYLSGSSSFYLKNLFSESLAGRKVIFELFPLDFEEFLIFKQKHTPFQETFKEKEKSRNYIAFEKLKKEYDEFVLFGGFPQVVLEEDEQHKRRMLKDIFSAYFEKDVKTLSDFNRINVLRDLILLLFQRIGSKLDISKIASALNTSRPTLYNYLSFLEQTYFVSFITPYSKSVDREVSGTRKVFACDTGLVNLFSQVDAGNLLENAVYNCIKHHDHGKIHYYQKRSGGEIDFILPKSQVALEVKTKAIRQDVDKLKGLAQKLGFKESYVISKDFTDLKDVILTVNL